MSAIFRYSVVFFAVLCTLQSGALLADVYVIAHRGVSIGEGDVREVFLGNMQFAGGAKLTPVNNGSAQTEFLAKSLKMEVERYGVAWTKKIFRDGINAPLVKASDVEVLAFVRMTPRAVGYVKTEPSGVTVIQKFD